MALRRPTGCRSRKEIRDRRDQAGLRLLRTRDKRPPGQEGAQENTSVSAKCKEPLCGRPFPQVACDRQAQRYAFNQPLVCVHPVLRSTHAWLLLASGTTSYRILCTAVYLPSDHPHLQGCSGCDPGRALVLWEQELGEAAQAPERSRFHGSKGKAQVGGDL
jgi:hypothetical protein